MTDDRELDSLIADRHCSPGHLILEIKLGWPGWDANALVNAINGSYRTIAVLSNIAAMRHAELTFVVLTLGQVKSEHLSSRFCSLLWDGWCLAFSASFLFEIA